MEHKTRTLTDADISCRRTVTRRSLMHTLGIGAAVAAVAGTKLTQAQPKPRDPCRDRDHGASDEDGCGRPTS